MTDNLSDEQPIRRDPELHDGGVTGTAATASPETVGGTDADPERRELRSAIGKYTSLASFPTTAGELADRVSAADAPDAVVRTVRELPRHTRLENPQELWVSLGLEATNRF